MGLFAVLIGFTIAKFIDPILFILALLVGFKAKSRFLVFMCALAYGMFSGLFFNGFSGEKFFLTMIAGLTASFAWFFLVFEFEQYRRRRKIVDVEQFE